MMFEFLAQGSFAWNKSISSIPETSSKDENGECLVPGNPKGQ